MEYDYESLVQFRTLLESDTFDQFHSVKFQKIWNYVLSISQLDQLDVAYTLLNRGNKSSAYCDKIANRMIKIIPRDIILTALFYSPKTNLMSQFQLLQSNHIVNLKQIIKIELMQAQVQVEHIIQEHKKNQIYLSLESKKISTATDLTRQANINKMLTTNENPGIKLTSENMSLWNHNKYLSPLSELFAIHMAEQGKFDALLDAITCYRISLKDDLAHLILSKTIARNIPNKLVWSLLIHIDPLTLTQTPKIFLSVVEFVLSKPQESLQHMHSLFYQLFLPAILHMDSEKFSIQDMQSLITKVFGLFNIAEPKKESRMIIYSWLVYQQTFSMHTQDQTTYSTSLNQYPSQSQILQNLSYSFRCLIIWNSNNAMKQPSSEISDKIINIFYPTEKQSSC